MRMVLFSGPTLPPDLLRRHLNEFSNLADGTVEIRPPATCGDVLDAALSRPNVIAVIDGYFDGAAAVWHKELLWALAQGIHVFGASSMGALRAAELAPFGMRGIGQVFERYRDGVYVDDDAVAVAHATAEYDYRTASDALVNLRATFERAAANGLLSPPLLSELVARAEVIPYWDRTYGRVLGDMGEHFESSSEGIALRRWLETGRVNQKRDDAVLLLATLAHERTALETPAVPSFVFSHTEAWQELYVAVSERRTETRSVTSTGPAESWYDEVLVAVDSEELLRAALGRALSERVAPESARNSPALVAAAEERFRRARGLMTPEDYRAWLTAQGLHSDAQAIRVFASNGLQHRARLVLNVETKRHLITELQARGRWRALQERAASKLRALESCGLSTPTLTDVDISEDQLWSWFFQELHRNAVPSDLHCHAEERGIDLEQLRRAALREYCMVKSST